MKMFARALQVLICILVLSAEWPGVAAAQGLSESFRASLAGPWSGLWTSDTHEYEAALKMTIAANGDAEGAITWTLRKSNRPDYQAKLGLTGIEYVRGRFDARTWLLRLDGYRLDDPNKILGMDKYRMAVAENLKTMGGITWDHNTWAGRIFLRR